MGNILYCPSNRAGFEKSIMRISDLLSLLSQQLNLENNSIPQGWDRRQRGFLLSALFLPFFTLSPLCLREEDIDSK